MDTMSTESSARIFGYKSTIILSPHRGFYGFQWNNRKLDKNIFFVIKICPKDNWIATGSMTLSKC